MTPIWAREVLGRTMRRRDRPAGAFPRSRRRGAIRGAAASTSSMIAANIAISDEPIRGARRAYYAMIGYADEQLGRFWRRCEAPGRPTTPSVVVTADHGDMLGERGLWYKMTFFERAMRVPLHAASPQPAGSRGASARAFRWSIFCRR